MGSARDVRAPELFSDIQPATHAAIFDYILRNEDSFFRLVG